jgi:tripartite-type tricarboxylate transporter receptor subunit TctC
MTTRTQSGQPDRLAARRAPWLWRASLALALASLSPLQQTGAQTPNWPTHPVKIIVPFGAGGPADIYGRSIAQGLTESLGQQFIVEDRPGAGSVPGTDAVAKATPDGYTLVIISNTQAINDTLYPKLPYSLLRDFTPVTQVNSMPNVLVVSPTLGIGSVAELIAAARQRPGKLNYSSSGSGTPYHLAAELFKTMASVDIVHVPYRASGDARTAVLAGQVQMMFDSLPTTLSQIKGGKMRGLAITSPKRSSLLPDVPTMSEAGVTGYEADLWIGLLAPRGTPTAIVERLQSSAARFLARADVVANYHAQGTVPIGSTPAQFGAVLQTEVEKWGRVVKFSGATVD